ncbi:CXXX repeat peptide maturase [Anaeroselena agilis]|uniref:CXXX repeat peptide maturase n=1 Tax=Anaeroselena agilis TaxID=3063788 RepID=A0ABU3P050_9FIRM|nr:CXXX repeat peptide maturase [Selenomonadales bacterium 4137-cl]
MLTHLLVLVDGSAPPFCHYGHDRRECELMPLATLKKAVAFARSGGLALTLLLGREELPPAYRAALAETEFAAIVPAGLANRYPDAILVLDAEDPGSFPDEACAGQRLILRLPRRRLGDMAALVASCAGRAARLDLYLADIDRYTAADIGEYGRQLKLAAEYVTDLYRQGSLPEMNIFSDRLLLSGMRNCDAGAAHLTVAPNGLLYICPGFYYDDEEHPAGSLADGVTLANRRLLELTNAPICSCCDAFHCKRCIYLNRKTTLEWNTPSREQCVLAHLERNAAGLIREQLGTTPPFSRLRFIPAIDYLDPFEQMPTRRTLP